MRKQDSTAQDRTEEDRGGGSETVEERTKKERDVAVS